MSGRIPTIREERIPNSENALNSRSKTPHRTTFRDPRETNHSHRGITVYCMTTHHSRL